MAFGNMRNDLEAGFNIGARAGNQINDNIRANALAKTTEARRALEDQALEQSMKERELRMNLIGQPQPKDPQDELYKSLRNQQLQQAIDEQNVPTAPPADPQDFASAGGDGTPADVDPADVIAASFATNPVGQAGGATSGKGSKKSGVSSVMDDVLSNYKLIQAGGLAKQQSDQLTQQMADMDAQLAKVPSTDPTRAALESQRQDIATKISKLGGMQQAIELTGSARLQDQLPKNKDGSLNWSMMTDAQKEMAGHVGLQAPPPPAPDPTTDPIGAALAEKQQELGQTIASNPTNSASLLDYVPFVGGAQAKRKGIEADISALQAQQQQPSTVSVPSAPTSADTTNPLPPIQSLTGPAPTTPASPSSPSGIPEGTRAVNRKTGQRIIYKGGQWQPAQ